MFDAYSSSFLEDPYSTYELLRRDTPVFYDEEWALTFVTRHGDVLSVLKDRERFGRDFRHRMGPEDVDQGLYERIYPPRWPVWTKYIRESFIDLEPPRHTRLRRLVSKAFTRRSAEAFRERLEAASDALLREIIDRGTVDVIADYATPIPVAMIAALMGIPNVDHPQLIGWSHAIVRVFDERVTEIEGDQAEQATRDFVAYVEETMEQRRRHPGDDLVSAMIDVEDEGDRLSDDEIVSTVILTLNAGHEATVHAIGNALLALGSDRRAYGELRSGDANISTAVDELLRFDSPLQMFERWVLVDTEVSGHELAKGTKVGLLFGSANHDPSVFADPRSLDLSRHPNPHVSFGAGLHYCVGAPLAKVELESALGRFAARVAEFEIAGYGDRIESLVFRGLRRLEIAVTPA